MTRKRNPRFQGEAIKKNENDVQTFCESLPDNLNSLSENRPESESKKRTRFFVQDESRLGLMFPMRRRITAKGIKPIQVVDFRFENYYLYGAVEPISGDRFILELPYLNSDCFQVFLNEFSSYCIDDFIILLVDNSSTHKAKKLVIPKNIVLLFLPPYSPELNPIERLWQHIKSKVTFSFLESLEALKQNVADELLKLTDSIVASITGYSYIVNAMNSLMHNY